MILQTIGLIAAIIFSNIADANIGEGWGVLYYYITILGFTEIGALLLEELHKLQS